MITTTPRLLIQTEEKGAPTKIYTHDAPRFDFPRSLRRNTSASSSSHEVKRRARPPAMADFGDDRTILVPGEELLVLCACPPDEPDPLSHELDARGARVGMSCDDGTNCWTPFSIPDEPSDATGNETDVDPFPLKEDERGERAVASGEGSDRNCWAPFATPTRPGDAMDQEEPAPLASASSVYGEPSPTSVAGESTPPADPVPSRKVFSSGGNSSRLIWTTDSNGQLVQEHTEEPHPKAERKEEVPEIEQTRTTPDWLATKPSPNRSLQYRKPKPTSLACQCAIA